MNISSREGIISSVEDKWRITVLTAIAPAAWGSNYYVAQHFLQDDAVDDGAHAMVDVGLSLGQHASDQLQ